MIDKPENRNIMMAFLRVLFDCKIIAGEKSLWDLTNHVDVGIFFTTLEDWNDNNLAGLMCDYFIYSKEFKDKMVLRIMRACLNHKNIYEV